MLLLLAMTPILEAILALYYIVEAGKFPACTQHVDDVHATHFLRTTRPTWFRIRYPLPAIRLGRASKASIAALLATYLLRDRAFSPLGARLS